jgi:cell division protein FtsB
VGLIPGRRKLIWIFSITLAMFLAYSAVGERGFIRLHQLMDERDNLELRVRTLEEENARMAEEIGLLSDDPATIESLARIGLGLVRPGEIVYILPDVAGESP